MHRLTKREDSMRYRHYSDEQIQRFSAVLSGIIGAVALVIAIMGIAGVFG